LVETLPEESEESSVDWLDLETVLVSSDASLLPVVRSLLEAEGIPCFVQGELMQDFLGLGRLATGANQIFGPVEVQVPKERAQAARDLLEAANVAPEGEVGPG
jgi:hypothetical protein